MGIGGKAYAGFVAKTENEGLELSSPAEWRFSIGADGMTYSVTEDDLRYRVERTP